VKLPQWERAKEIFDVASDLPASARESYLIEACGTDDVLFRELISLLNQHDQAGSFLRASSVGSEIANTTKPPEPFIASGQCLAERFRIRRFIGSGGMGEVYEAVDLRVSQVIALKLLRPALLSEETIERFRQEVRLARCITHPNVCRIFDLEEHTHSDQSQQLVFLTMEFIDGQTLAETLRNRPPMPLRTALPVLSQIAQALAAAHNAGIIHRDLKPSNVILAEDGRRAVVTDFGIAQLLSPSNRSVGLNAKALTAPDNVVGTLSYLAPEQIEGLASTYATDIYMFGLVAYEMTTGRQPFSGPNPLAGLVERIKGRLRSPREYVDYMGPQLESMILACLAADPSQRIRDAGVLIETLRQETSRLLSGTTSSTPRSHNASPSGPSVAILPFINVGGNSEDLYISDGLAEELIGALSRVEGIRVVARTSSFHYRNRTLDVREIARRLNADMLIEGTVQRLGNRLRISARLIGGNDGYHLWSERYDRQMEDVFILQEEIAGKLAVKLKLGLLEKPPTLPKPPHNVEAYNLFLKGRFFLNRRSAASVQKAIQCFELATKHDMQFVRAVAALADCYTIAGIYGMAQPGDAFSSAKESVSRGLLLDSSIPELHCASGCIEAVFEWNWASAERAFLHALSLDPNNVITHHSYAVNFLIPLLRFREAHEHLQIALHADPLSLIINTSIGLLYHCQRHYDEAIREYIQVLDIDSNFGLAHFFLGQSYEQVGQLEKARTSFEQALTLTDRSSEALAFLGRANAILGRRGEAYSQLQELTKMSATAYVSPVLLAQLHLGFGDQEQAIAALEKALDVRAADLIWANVRPSFDTLRPEARFRSILQRLSLPSSQ
jgi:serine/threonine protein kinase/tetratricopeptide (TPR) repeat protein